MTDTWSTILPYIGQLAPFVEDPDVSEIMCNPGGDVFVERAGLIRLEPDVRLLEPALEAAVKRIARELGQDISPSKPLLEARLPDGSRVAAVFPPCSVGGITFSIRKFQYKRFDMDELVNCGTITTAQKVQLLAAISSRRNILISGGTGPAKPRYSMRSPPSSRMTNGSC